MRLVVAVCAVTQAAQALDVGGKWKAPRSRPLLESKALAKSLATWSVALLAIAGPAVTDAADKRSVGAIAGSGLLFKDRLVVDAFPDPKIEGVTVYLSDFERPITERMQKDFFSDPSQAGLTCARRGEIKVKGELSTSVS